MVIFTWSEIWRRLFTVLLTSIALIEKLAVNIQIVRSVVENDISRDRYSMYAYIGLVTYMFLKDEITSNTIQHKW